MFSSIAKIEEYLLELVPKTTQVRYPGQRGIARMREFMKLLGSPQNKLKVVHVAGTSGKGSTSFMISSLLVAHGFKVGLHLSPHLLDIRERTEINNRLIEERKYCRYFSAFTPFIEKMKQSTYGPVTYFEANVGFAYFVFNREHVDYAIIETGLGGEYDGTNVVDRKDKLSIITKIGFDHMNILGNTLAKIAHQKAMISATGGELITIEQSRWALDEIRRVANQKKARLHIIKRNSTSEVTLSEKQMEFTFRWNSFSVKKCTLGLIGTHQIQNTSLALSTLSLLAKRDGFVPQTSIIRKTLRHIRFKGRLDIIPKTGGKIILDGAHNVQKMKALLIAIKKIYPDKKFTFVIAFKKGKECRKMIKLIIPFAKKIVVTHIFSDSQDLLHLSTLPAAIIEEVRLLGFSSVTVKENMHDIITEIQRPDTLCIVTGSLYLLGDIYKHLE